MSTEQQRFGRNLKRARQNAKLSQEQLAQTADAGSKGYISNLETGQRPIPPGGMLEKLAGALNVSVSDLVGDGPRLSTVPIVGYVGAGAEAHLYSEGQGPFGDVEAPDEATEDTVAVEIRGESLGALFNEWLVFYDDVQSPVTPDLHGRLCVVGLPDGRVLVKQIKPAGGGRFHLIANNEGPLLDQDVAWAAQVKTMRPK